MEIRERVSFRKSLDKTQGDDSEHIHDSKEGLDLACQCDSYFCSCRKQCFCSLKAEPFDGETVGACGWLSVSVRVMVGFCYGYG